MNFSIINVNESSWREGGGDADCIEPCLMLIRCLECEGLWQGCGVASPEPSNNLFGAIFSSTSLPLASHLLPPSTCVTMGKSFGMHRAQAPTTQIAKNVVR